MIMIGIGFRLTSSGKEKVKLHNALTQGYKDDKPILEPLNIPTRDWHQIPLRNEKSITLLS